MDTVENIFWNKRMNKLNTDLNFNLQGLYTWAVLVNKCIEDKKQWLCDKKTITGQDMEPCNKLHAAEQALASNIINFILSRDDQINNELLDNCEMLPSVKSVTGKSTSSNMPTNSLAYMADKLLQEHDTEQEELEKSINARRERMMRDQLDLIDETRGDNLDISCDDNLNIPCGANNALEGCLGSPPTTGCLGRTQEISSGPTATDSMQTNSEPPVKSGRPPRADPSTVIPDDQIPPSKLALEVARAPTINALYRLDKNDREDMLELMFITASKNVNAAVTGLNKTKKEIEDLTCREMDRLLEVYMKTH